MDDKYIISDVSKILDIEPHVLRYWEEELSLNISRNQLGHRYYNENDLEILKRIKSLKEQGFQLRAIKSVIATHEHTPGTKLAHTDRGEVIEQHAIESYNHKLKQFEVFFKDVVYMSLEENNKILKEEIAEAFMAKMQPIYLKQEELDEKRYRKLDETIREIQKVRQEMAASKNKWFFKKKPVDTN